MSAQNFPGTRALRPGPRWLWACACAALLALTVICVTRNSQSRRSWVAAAQRQQLEKRHSAVMETATLIEGSEEAGLLIAESLIEEPGPHPGQARDLVLHGMAGRPGSAYARLLLGRTALLTDPTPRWVRPIELAAAAAPGLAAASSELAGRYLAVWGSLPPAERANALAAVRRAFQDPGFVRAALPTTVEVLGPDQAVQALPDDPRTLRLAATVLQESGGGPASILVARRLGTPAPASLPTRASRPTP